MGRKGRRARSKTKAEVARGVEARVSCDEAAPSSASGAAEASSPASEGAAATPAPPDDHPPPPRDEASVPPMGDLEAGFDLDGDFFRATHADAASDAEMRDPRLAMKMTAQAIERRAHLARYVKGAVAVASVLCLAAVVKATATRTDAEPERHRTAPAVAIAEARKPTVAAAETREAPVAPPGPSEVAPPEPSVGATAPPEPSPSVASAAGARAPVHGENDVAPPDDPREAARAKAASQANLEAGKVAAAIEAGERAVQMDPTDGEAWLVLGAAYQQRGDWKEARRCYRTCVERGTRGPKAECGAMLR